MAIEDLLSIPEIHDLVAMLLSTSDYLALCRVSRQFHTIFIPKIWSRVYFDRPQDLDSFEKGLSRHGSLIQHLRVANQAGHNRLPWRIRQYCIGIVSLVVLDHNIQIVSSLLFHDDTRTFEPPFRSLSILELDLSTDDCQLFLSASLAAIKASRGSSWASLHSLRIKTARYRAIFFSLSDFLRTFPNLRQLRLHWMTLNENKTHKDANMAASSSESVNWIHGLHELYLPRTCISAPNLLEALQRLPLLQSLHIADFSNYDGIQSVFKNLHIFCPHLTTIAMLGDGHPISNDLWIDLFRKSPGLRGFHIGNTGFNDAALRMLQHHCGDLEELSISSEPAVTAQGVREVLEDCPRLVRLELWLSGLSSEVFVGLREWACRRTLSEIFISRLEVRTNDHEQIGARLQGLENLRRLTFGCDRGHMDMLLFRQRGQAIYPKLEFLWLQNMEPRMTAEQMGQLLAALPRVHEMTILHCLSDEAKEWLQHHHHHRHLNIHAI